MTETPQRLETSDRTPQFEEKLVHTSAGIRITGAKQG